MATKNNGDALAFPVHQCKGTDTPTAVLGGTMCKVKCRPHLAIVLATVGKPIFGTRTFSADAVLSSELAPGSLTSRSDLMIPGY